MWMQLAQAGANFLSKRSEAKRQRSWDRYNNAMVGIQAGQANNSITQNVVMNKAKHAENKLAIQTSRLIAAAKVKAGAAAAGVAGGSVEATIFDIGRNAAKATKNETDRFTTSLLATDAQRRSLSMSRKLSQRPETELPSLLGAAFSAGVDILGERETDTRTSNGTLLEGGSNQSDPWANMRSKYML